MCVCVLEKSFYFYLCAIRVAVPFIFQRRYRTCFQTVKTATTTTSCLNTLLTLIVFAFSSCQIRFSITKSKLRTLFKRKSRRHRSSAILRTFTRLNFKYVVWSSTIIDSHWFVKLLLLPSTRFYTWDELWVVYRKRYTDVYVIRIYRVFGRNILEEMFMLSEWKICILYK